ncbi:DUF4381 domain-containing protein (plasmid) [Salipiger sp. H15]|uniref:DUF4381 domain-containing protein n=1 Tax=Alloyangia sp. H15 TaxID=3029062 RepID=A0AAU8ASB0_9RHOB
MNPDLENLDLVELLKLLEMPPDPAQVSYAPQTAGWWVMAAAALIVLAALVWALLRHRRANAYRRAALRALEQADDDPAQIAAVLRRTAVAAYPRRQVAKLYGEAWLNFLDTSFAGEGFADGPGRVLSSAAYRPVAAADPLLRSLAERWIRSHKRGKT